MKEEVKFCSCKNPRKFPIADDGVACMDCKLEIKYP